MIAARQRIIAGEAVYAEPVRSRGVEPDAERPIKRAVSRARRCYAIATEWVTAEREGDFALAKGAAIELIGV
jgi:hypothetical protein